MPQRLTINLDDALVEAIDAFMVRRGSTNRSEAMRDLVREALARDVTLEAEACVAAVSYVYDHDERGLAARLVQTQHARHDVTVATLHAHIDHHHCMEVALLKGPVAAVQGLAAAILAERGVKCGHVNVVPLVAAGPRHAHGDHAPDHVHLKPVL